MAQTTWLEIEPIDTLFFRGAESMEAGENHEVDTMFPPMPATITGAVRTAILGQRCISPAEYLDHPQKWQKKYPFLGSPKYPGFTLLGPLFMAESDCLLLPVPATWYGDIPESNRIKWGTSYQVQAAQPLGNNALGLCGSVAEPFWLHRPSGNDMQPLAGYWANAAAFAAMKEGASQLLFSNDTKRIKEDKAAVVATSSLFTKEERIGLALTRQRTAKDGHLYSAAHIRLRDGVRMVAGLYSEHQPCLDDRGIIQLGGEQRICRYHTLKNPLLPANKNSRCLYSISPLEFSKLPEDMARQPRASGKLLRIGGWDMRKKFHKPMSAWLPAGTVIYGDQTTSELPQFLNI